MTLTLHELRRGRTSFLIWTGAVAFLLAVCIFLYPEMKEEMTNINETFSSMGSFTAAFGMDRLNFGTLIGYYAIECGNVLGLGGALYAALIAVSALCGEEKNRTAEFLLTHPVKRRRVAAQKLFSVVIRVAAMNAAILVLSVFSMAAIGEAVPWKEVMLLHAAYLIMQLELASICFGISAYLSKGSVGAGLGVAALAYFLNIIANITDGAGFLKFITPFGYCEGANIVNDGALDGVKIAIGVLIGALCIAAAFIGYTKKDIK
ncbi:MAG: ABC transporter permease subunit [Clostridia bacterium]|nr:ABC transporter permease subunit [Clostridia bacterium]